MVIQSSFSCKIAICVEETRWICRKNIVNDSFACDKEI